MGGVEGVGHLVEGDPVEQSDGHVLGEIERAQVLQQDVVDAGSAEELAPVRRDDLVVLGGEDGVLDAGDGVAAFVEFGEEGEPTTWSARAGVWVVSRSWMPGKYGSRLVMPDRVVPWLSGAMPTRAFTLAAPPRNLR